jgi:hypothetical protein
MQEINNNIDGTFPLISKWNGDFNSLCVIDPKEIRVEDSLDNPCNNGNRVPEAWFYFCKGSIDPVRDVKSPISSKREEIVGSNGLSFSCPL